MLCLVWDFAMGEEGLTGVLDTDFSYCRMFNDKRNCSAYADNNKQKSYLELYTMQAAFGQGEGYELRTMT